MASIGSRNEPPRHIVTYISSGHVAKGDDLNFDPDWSDPATIGCLVAQVREAFPCGQVSAFPVCIDGKEIFACWHYGDDGRHLTSYGETEVAALLAALDGKGV